MKQMQGLRMHLVGIVLVLVLALTSVSASFEMNDTEKDVYTETRPQLKPVGDADGEAAAPLKSDGKRAEFIFHCMMVGFIIVGCSFFITVALIKALTASKGKDEKPNGSLDVEKIPWI